MGYSPRGRKEWDGATVHGVAKSGTRLSDFTFTFREGFMKFKQRSKGSCVYLGGERCKQKGAGGQLVSEIKEENAARSRSCKASKVFCFLLQVR